MTRKRKTRRLHHLAYNPEQNATSPQKPKTPPPFYFKKRGLLLPH
jgi:hypothetical protein